ncbi:hypothetical protein F0562_020679 [Nyssa sinensis]|uniref:BZIP domain-containing protein n=1 Tax=Nyssa sinensis TaxID=561372 RepID=A0A5J5BUW6_9ASTE|nr:hypothetical protein F0562_020679 [Nyssa sinensis]
MGSYINFKNFSETPHMEGRGGNPTGNFPLARQSSIYSLTFDEFQNTWGGLGKDFGSMNMDELLKNIWTAEETQSMATSTCGAEGSISGGNLQRQGSLTLPRTLSQKTVDEVWRDLLRESGGEKDGSGTGGSNLQQRQQTLGEMTLEEFLVRAGVVREDAQPIGRPNNSGFWGEISPPSNNNTGFTIGFQQPARNNGVMANQSAENNNLHQHQQQPFFPKQATVAFASPLHLVSNAQLSSPGTRAAIVGMADPPMNNALVQGGVIQSGSMGMAGLGSGATTVAAGTPGNQLSSDVKSSVNTSSLSPVPYMFNEGGRGRKCNGALEKVVERRHRRMLKNRESAARSRARKQAYTLELEAEVAKLKEINQELQKKQEEIMEMQKNQVHAPFTFIFFLRFYIDKSFYLIKFWIQNKN